MLRFSVPDSQKNPLKKTTSKKFSSAHYGKKAEEAFPFTDFVPTCGVLGPGLHEVPSRLYAWLLDNVDHPLASRFHLFNNMTPSPLPLVTAKDLLPLPLAEPFWKSGSSATQRTKCKDTLAWLFLVVLGLNRVYGLGKKRVDVKPSSAQLACIGRLYDHIFLYLKRNKSCLVGKDWENI